MRLGNIEGEEEKDIIQISEVAILESDEIPPTTEVGVTAGRGIMVAPNILSSPSTTNSILFMSAPNTT